MHPFHTHSNTSICDTHFLFCYKAVDSYRNRFPESRSRRVVRQEKLVKGTLRVKRETNQNETDTDQDMNSANTSTHQSPMDSIDNYCKNDNAIFAHNLISS